MNINSSSFEAVDFNDQEFFEEMEKNMNHGVEILKKIQTEILEMRLNIARMKTQLLMKIKSTDWEKLSDLIGIKMKTIDMTPQVGDGNSSNSA